MKKTAFTKYTSWVVGLLVLAVSACSPAERLRPDDDGEHQCPLQLVGGVIPFDGAGTKSAGAFAFSKENRMYVRLIGAAGPVLGQATYDEETGTWSFTYNGSLAGATSGDAHAILFEKNIQNETSMGLTLRYNTPVYEDAHATFSVDENGLNLHSTLAPKTGRISFVHDLEEGQSRSFNRAGGITYYSTFDLSTFSFQTQEISKIDGFSLSRSETGNGEYIYGFFTDKEAPRIMLYYFINNIGIKYYYKFLPQEALESGKSGYVDTPDVNPTGWQKYANSRYFDVNDNGSYANFEMIFVPGGCFQMGNDGDPTAQPAHPVTLKPYYIGRIEVTQALWYVVMGEPSDWQGKILPVYNRSYEEIQKFISALQSNIETTSKYRFRLPTEAEWEFAARGGVYSRGYTYSGGNTLSEVAVRQTDYSIDSKNSNELSLRDMSGNVAELCADWFGPYPSEAQVNPTGPASGEFRVVRGGYSYDPDEYFTVWHRASTDEYGGLPSGAVGFRLVMEAPVIEVE